MTDDSYYIQKWQNRSKKCSHITYATEQVINRRWNFDAHHRCNQVKWIANNATNYKYNKQNDHTFKQWDGMITEKATSTCDTMILPSASMTRRGRISSGPANEDKANLGRMSLAGTDASSCNTSRYNITLQWHKNYQHAAKSTSIGNKYEKHTMTEVTSIDWYKTENKL